MKKKRGGQTLPADEKRTHCVSVRLNQVELAELDQAREKTEMQRGTYLRSVSRGVVPKIIPEINKQAWRELARMAGNLNQLQAAINSGQLVGGQVATDMITELYLEVQGLRMELIGGGDESQN